MTTPKRLLVFPNDPIHQYLEKGEAKERYFNPENFFDEVHVMEFADTPSPTSGVQALAGRARLCTYAVGTLTTLMRSGRFFSLERAVAQRVQSIRPSVIRGYNSSLGGYMAVRVARRLGIPSVISLHIDRDDVRRYERLPLRHRLFEAFSRLVFEPYTMQHADVVLPVSEFLRGYATRYGARNAHVIYNRVSVAQFRPPANRPPHRGKFRVLSVGRLDPQKRHEVLIRAIRDLPIELVIIGDGVRRAELQSLVRELGCSDRVRFIPSVPHHAIAPWYWWADAFALATQYEGFCIPVLEAMAAGLPVVVNDAAPLPELVGDAGCIVPASPAAFRDALMRLQIDTAYRSTIAARALRRAATLDGVQFEQREADVYRMVMG